MKLISYWTSENDKALTDLLWREVMHNDGYNIPSYLEVKQFLKSTDVDGFKEFKMGDLVIHFENQKFKLEVI